MSAAPGLLPVAPGVPRIGCDPGLSGALVVVDEREIIASAGMPICYSARPRRPSKPDVGDPVPAVDVGALILLFGKWRDRYGPELVIYSELVDGHAGESASRAFAFGRYAGALEAAQLLSGLPVVMVHPAIWKRRAGLLSTKGRKVPKGAAQDAAAAIFPGSRGKVIGDTATSEAALIAYYGPEFPRRQREVNPW